MDASVFALDLPTWLSWTSAVLYVAGFCLSLFAIVLVGCIAGQMMTADDHPVAPKSRTHLAH